MQRNLAALHVGVVQHVEAGAAGGELTASVPLAQLATLDLDRLSRQLRALRWIGQGGGAVFSGRVAGRPRGGQVHVAEEPLHVNAAALESVLSSAVGHPNVIHTYSFSVTRLTEGSFADAPRHTGSLATGGGATTELYLALMQSAGEAGQNPAPDARPARNCSLSGLSPAPGPAAACFPAPRGALRAPCSCSTRSPGWGRSWAPRRRVETIWTAVFPPLHARAAAAAAAAVATAAALAVAAVTLARDLMERGPSLPAPSGEQTLY